jgi:hypothetical protein
MEVGGQHNVSAALPPGKTRYPWYRRMGDPQDRVRKISTLPGLDSRTLQLVASSYTDWAIPAHLSYSLHLILPAPTYRYLKSKSFSSMGFSFQWLTHWNSVPEKGLCLWSTAHRNTSHGRCYVHLPCSNNFGFIYWFSKNKWGRLLQGRFTTSVGNYGCRSAMRRRRQLRTYKQVSCFCLKMRQTSSDDFNCVLLLLIVKCINPCIVLN